MKRLLAILSITVMIATTNAQTIKGRFAIQNIQTGKNLRPFEASKTDGNSIVLYTHHSWKCMTWDFVHLGGDIYQFKNRYTTKAIQLSAASQSAVTLVQQPLNGDSTQQWEFIKQPSGNYLIRSKGSDLYITISSEQTNSPVTLSPFENTSRQLWRLVEQDPWF